jgi:hypothetical protein
MKIIKDYPEDLHNRNIFPDRCPFCSNATYEFEKEEDPFMDTRVRCARCHSCGPWEENYEEAVTEWNKRLAF